MYSGDLGKVQKYKFCSVMQIANMKRFETIALCSCIVHTNFIGLAICIIV